MLDAQPDRCMSGYARIDRLLTGGSICRPVFFILLPKSREILLQETCDRGRPCLFERLQRRLRPPDFRNG